MTEKKDNIKRISVTDKAVYRARGEAIFVMGGIVGALTMLLSIYAIATGGKVFGYITILAAYIAGASLYLYRYQKTNGFMAMGIVGIILTVLCFVMFCFL